MTIICTNDTITDKYFHPQNYPGGKLKKKRYLASHEMLFYVFKKSSDKKSIFSVQMPALHCI